MFDYDLMVWHALVLVARVTLRAAEPPMTRRGAYPSHMTKKKRPMLQALVLALALASPAFAAAPTPTPTPRPVGATTVKSSKSNSSDRVAATPTSRPVEGKPSKEQRAAPTPKAGGVTQ